MKSWSSSTSLQCEFLSRACSQLIGSEDKRHGLKELAALDLVIEGQKKGISVSASHATRIPANNSTTILCDT
jgi:hypothetical protein